MTKDLLIENKKNQEFIENNLDKLKDLFLDKYLVVYKQEVVAICTSFREASELGVSKFGLNEAFLIYHVENKKPVNFVVHARPLDYSGSTRAINKAFC